MFFLAAFILRYVRGSHNPSRSRLKPTGIETAYEGRREEYKAENPCLSAPEEGVSLN